MSKTQYFVWGCECRLILRNHCTDLLVVVHATVSHHNTSPRPSKTSSPDMKLCYHTHFIFIVSLIRLSLFCLTWSCSNYTPVDYLCRDTQIKISASCYLLHSGSEVRPVLQATIVRRCTELVNLFSICLGI